MTGIITRIDEPKISIDGRHIFRRIYFSLGVGRWAKTDLVWGFRNTENWVGKLKVGNKLGGLRMKDENTVDADSKVRKIK